MQLALNIDKYEDDEYEVNMDLGQDKKRKYKRIYDSKFKIPNNALKKPNARMSIGSNLNR